MKKIMFSDEFGLTQAVLDGRKTMTRRIVSEKLLDRWTDYDDFCNNVSVENAPTERQYYDEKDFFLNNAPYKLGEVVAIAQSYRDSGYTPDSLDRHPKDLSVRGLMKDSAGWNNKMFVKSYACKHHIKITNVKIERLQDISDEDCLKEGIIRYTKDGTVYKYDLSDGFEMLGWGNMKRNPKDVFACLIDKVSGKGTWESNPFVFAYEFVLFD
uniref:hypothetical protein n=1 Tax=Bacteroides ovatus TaxID=28116 RepID=UPI00359C9585